MNHIKKYLINIRKQKRTYKVKYGNLYALLYDNDVVRVLKTVLKHRQLTKNMENLPAIRTDNGPQFVLNLFGDSCKLFVRKHQKIPVKTTN